VEESAEGNEDNPKIPTLPNRVQNLQGRGRNETLPLIRELQFEGGEALPEAPESLSPNIEPLGLMEDFLNDTYGQMSAL